MHYLGSTVRMQASLCGCTWPERANRLLLHFAAYVMHCSSSRAALHRVVQPIHPLRRQGVGEQAAPCDALVQGSWQCVTHAEVVYIL